MGIRKVRVSDLDGKDMKDGRTVTLGFDGVTREIDLHQREIDELAKLLEPYMSIGEEVGRTRAKSTGAKRGKSETAKMRDWGRENGFEVSNRGRVSTELRAAYRAAH